MRRKKITIPGDYQYWALTKGHTIQRFWHDNKLTLLDITGDFSINDTILDAGCGSGNISFYLADKVKEIVGSDINLEAIAFAQDRAKRLGLKNTVFKFGNLKKLPYEDDYFTKVILFEVVEHLNESDYTEILAEIHRVMKPGGLLHITTPNYKSLWPFLEWVLDTFNLAAILKNKQHVSQFTPESLCKLLNNQNFTVKRIGTINHLSPFLSVFSWKIAKQFFEWETKHGGSWGPIIYCVAVKKTAMRLEVTGDIN